MDLVTILNAQNHVYSTVQTSRSWIQANEFISALQSYYGSLQPTPLKISADHLQRLEQKIHEINHIARNFDQRLPRALALALLGDLLRERLLPPKNADEHDTIGMLGEFVSTITKPGPLGIQNGATEVYYPRTIRGFGDCVLEGGLDLAEPREIVSPPNITDPNQAGAVHTPPSLINEDNMLMILSPPKHSGGPWEERSSQYRIVSLDQQGKVPRPIGKGGTSRIYQGVDMYEGNDIADVAIKVVYIQDEKMAAEIKQGFANGLTLSMKHLRGSQKFVEVFSAGRTVQGTPYSVMELMRGGSVAGYIFERKKLESPLSLDEKLAICKEMIEAVAELQIVFKRIHRDIKPENFLLSEKIVRENERGEDEEKTFLTTPNCRIKLSDFDLTVEADAMAQLPLEPPEDFYGTPGFFHIGEPDTYRRDVLALAATCYFVLTGKRAFEGETGFKTAMAVIEKPDAELIEKLRENHIPQPLQQIILKGLSRKFEQRYKNAADLLFDFTTFTFQEMEEEAESQLKRDLENHVEEPIARVKWRQSIEKILSGLGKLRDRYHLHQFNQKMKELNLKLHNWHDRSGNDERRKYDAARVLALSGAETPPIEVTRPIQIGFSLDDPEHLLNGSWKVAILKHADNTGVLEFQNIVHTVTSNSQREIPVPRDYSYSLLFSAPGVMPIHIPAPPRPGRYNFRIPVYRRTPELDSCVIIPAGPVIVKEVPGTSHSEKIKELRFTDRDLAMKSASTDRDWIPYLRWTADRFSDPLIANAEVLKRVPLYWKEYFLKNDHFYDQLDEDIFPLDAPVTHVSANYVSEYIKEFLPKNSRFPTMDEWKRAMRGNDARPWPWGTELPDKRRQLIAGCRHTRHMIAVTPLANDHRGILDYSPFSIPAVHLQPANKVAHIGLNFFKPLAWPENPEERKRMMRAVGLSHLDAGDPSIPERYLFLAGTPYDAPPPTNLEIIQKQPIDYIGPMSAIIVIPLRKANPTPSIEELRQ